MAYADIDPTNLYLGAIVTIYSRQLKLVEYGDVFTRVKFSKERESTFALIKPDAYVHTGKILDAIYKSGFVVKRLKMGKFTAATTARFLADNDQKSEEASQHLMSDVSTGLEIVADNGQDKAKILAEQLQKQFGTGGSSVRNAFHVSRSLQAAR